MTSTPVPIQARRDRRRPLLAHGVFLGLAALLLATAGATTVGPTAAGAPPDSTGIRLVAHRYHDGVFSQAAPRFCTATRTFTPSRRIRTRIVRSTDGWANTISSRYRKWVHCTARQMTPTMWCTTRLVDGFSGICISPEPRARGTSPCRNHRLDVRSVYYPRTGRLAITCVNRAT